MYSYANFAEVLNERAKNSPNQLAAEFLNDNDSLDSLTYAELHEKAQVIADEILKTCKKGDRVVLLYPPNMQFMLAFWGCIYAGVIAVASVLPVKKTSFNKRIQHIFESCNPSLCLTDSTIARLLKLNKLHHRFSKIPLIKGLSKKIMQFNPLDSNFLLGNVPLVLTDKLKSKASEWLSRSTGDDVMFLQFTSGSTSIPKGVIVTHENVLSNLSILAKISGVDKTTRSVQWIPPYHDMGLVNEILLPILVGYPVRIIPTFRFIRDPLMWLEHMTDFKGTLSGSPNFAYDICNRYYDEERMSKLDLSAWIIPFCGAEITHYDTLSTFENLYSKHGFKRNKWLLCYGLAETTLFVSGIKHYDIQTSLLVDAKALKDNKISILNQEDKDGLRILSCGINYPGQSLKIVDDEHNPLNDDQIGSVFISSKSVAKGYWNSPDNTEHYFNLKIKGDEKDYLDTGDLGFIHDQQLYLTGRKKEVIIIHGKNYYPQWIERSLQDLSPLIRKNCTLIFQLDEISRDHVIVTMEIYEEKLTNNAHLRELAVAINQIIRNEHELQVDRVVFFAKNSLSKTTSGKLPRIVIAKQYLNNELNPLYTWYNFSTTNKMEKMVFDFDSYSKKDEENKVLYLNNYLIHFVNEFTQDPQHKIQTDSNLFDWLTNSVIQMDFLYRLESSFGFILEPKTMVENPLIHQFSKVLYERLAKTSPIEKKSAVLFDRDYYFHANQKKQHEYLGDILKKLIAFSLHQPLTIDFKKNLSNYIDDSLLMLDFISGLDQRLGVKLLPTELIKLKSIDALIATIHQRLQNVKAEEPKINKINRLPMLAMQHFMFDHVGLEEFNLARVVELEPYLQLSELNQTLHLLLNAQPYLRSLVDMKKRRFNTLAKDTPEKLYILEEVSLPEVNKKVLKTHIEGIIKENSKKISIEKGPLFCLTLCQLPHQKQMLVLVISHFIVDPYSLALVFNFIENSLKNKDFHQQIETQVNEEMNALNQLLAQSSDIKPKNSVVTLEKWHPSPIDNFNYNERLKNISFDSQITRQLQEFSQHYQLTNDSILLTAFLKSFSELVHKEQFLIQMMHHGRYLNEDSLPIINTIGWFNIGWPICLKVDNNHSLLEDIQQIEEELNKEKPSLAYYLQDSLIPPSLPEIEFSSLGKLNYAMNSLEYFKDSPLFENDYLQGETFGGLVERHRQIFVRPYWKNDRLNIPIFYNENLFSEADLNQLAESIYLRLKALAHHHRPDNN